MKSRAWQSRIRKTLEQLSARVGEVKVAVLGVGHHLYGDDAIGVEVARRLLCQDLAKRPDRLVLLGGPAPENFCGVLRRVKPHFVIMIDAAEMGLAIGSVRWLEWEHLPGWTVSTRSYPLHTMVSYLAQDVGSVVGVLGIQPDRVCLGTMSSKMSRRASEIAQQLHDVLHFPMNDVDDEFHASLVPQRKWIKHGA